jgi:hypothetical protein
MIEIPASVTVAGAKGEVPFLDVFEERWAGRLDERGQQRVRHGRGAYLRFVKADIGACAEALRAVHQASGYPANLAHDGIEISRYLVSGRDLPQADRCVWHCDSVSSGESAIRRTFPVPYGPLGRCQTRDGGRAVTWRGHCVCRS